MRRGTSCLCCGKQLTTGGPSVEHHLDFHLRAEHPEPKQAINTLIDMLQHFHENDSEQTCEWCLMDIKTAACDGDLSSHIAERGVVRNLLTWLCSPLLPHGDREPRPAGRGTGADGRRLGLEAGRENTPSLPSSKDSNSADITKVIQMMGSLLIRHERDLAALQSQNSYILFLHTGQDGIISSILNQSLEWKKKTEQQGNGMKQETVDLRYPLRQHLLLHILTLTLDRAQKINQCKKGDKLLEASVKSQLLLEDRSWPFLQWCHQTKSLVINGKQPSIPMDEMITSRPTQRGWDHSEIPLTSATQQPGAGDPLETGRGHEMSRGACLDQEASPIQLVSTGLSEDQTSLTTTKQAGRSTTTSPSAQEENQMILQLNLWQTITLVNNNVECYINSAFWTVCWAHLFCTQQSIDDWKGMNAPFHQMLCEGTPQKLDLKHHRHMALGMKQWQQLRQGGQQDFSEFLQFFLGWMNTKMVSLGYERRYTTSDGLQTVEKGGKHSPITLVSDLWCQLSEPFSFTMVLDNWMKQFGMHTALTLASPVLCLQVCRSDMKAWKFMIDVSLTLGTTLFILMSFPTILVLKLPRLNIH